MNLNLNLPGRLSMLLQYILLAFLLDVSVVIRHFDLSFLSCAVCEPLRMECHFFHKSLSLPSFSAAGPSQAPPAGADGHVERAQGAPAEAEGAPQRSLRARRGAHAQGGHSRDGGHCAPGGGGGLFCRYPPFRGWRGGGRGSRHPPLTRGIGLPLSL